MSAPRVVNLTDRSVWELRTETRGGQPLYAIAGAPKCCPPCVMATYAELEEHGIAGTADALPMSVGSVSLTARQRVDEAFGIEARLFQHALDKVFAVLKEGHFLRSAEAASETDALLKSLWARVAELETANAGLDDLRVRAIDKNEQLRDRIAELEGLLSGSIQTCRTCGAGFTFGKPCTTCDFQARMAAEASRLSGAEPVDRLTASFAPVAALREDPHDSPLHHPYLTSRDFPESGGAE